MYYGGNAISVNRSNKIPCQRTWGVQGYRSLFFLVPVGTASFLTLVRGYLVSFSFFTTWHMLCSK